MFDPNPDPNFPVGRWSKKKVRDETQRLKEILQILTARESNHTADIHRQLDAQDQQTARDTRDQQGSLDSISTNLLSVSTAVHASLADTQRAIWQIGNRTASAAEAHDALVATSWRRLTNESAALDRNSFRERANLARALAALARARSLSQEAAARYAAAVRRAQAATLEEMNNMGVGAKGDAADLDGQLLARRLRARHTRGCETAAAQ